MSARKKAPPAPEGFRLVGWINLDALGAEGRWTPAWPHDFTLPPPDNARTPIYVPVDPKESDR